MRYKKKIENKTHHTYELDGKDIVDMVLRTKQFKKGDLMAGVKDVRVTFNVPGGGDYSNIRLDIDKELPVTVSFTTEE